MVIKHTEKVNNSLNKIIKEYKFIILRGKTGTAKTRIIEKLIFNGASAINLENLAKHKGSLLGNYPNTPQPSQKFFESLLYYEFKKLKKKYTSFYRKRKQ